MNACFFVMDLTNRLSIRHVRLLLLLIFLISALFVMNIFNVNTGGEEKRVYGIFYFKTIISCNQCEFFFLMFWSGILILRHSLKSKMDF